ncbi:MAG: glycosyltransferase [Bacillota bacterium]
MKDIGIIDLLFMVSMISIWLLLFFHVILTYVGYRHFIKSIGYDGSLVSIERYPMVSVLIPAHNEEMVIGRTVDAMAKLDYPRDKIEIIVINDSSTDKTWDILAGKMAIYPQLRVVTINPPLGAKGKSNALNQGLKAASGELIAVYDADNTPERAAVRRLVEAIVHDSGLGAVVGKFRTRNRDTNLLTRFINVETLNFQWIVQAGRCSMFGLTTITGTNFVIRRNLLEEIGGWNTNALTEDTELTVRIYEYGYRISWLPDAVTWEQEPEKLAVWVKQRTRWARGNMWVISYYMGRLFSMKNRRISGDIVYFFFTYAIFFLSVVVSDVIFILGLTGTAQITINGPFTLIWFLAYTLFVLETYISVSFERGEGNIKNLLIICLMYFTYCQLWLYVVVRAGWHSLKDRITGKAFHWYKTERSSR